MTIKKLMGTAALAGLLGMAALAAQAQETIKVGVIAPFSGPFANHGELIEDGIKAYMLEHGDMVAGKKIEIIKKDTTGPQPDVAKRLAQELIVRDKVDFLAGFGLTPEALAVAALAEQAKKPMIIMNAATSIISTKSKYIARVSHTLAQLSAPMGIWAPKNGIKKVITLVADYGPGIDAETAFKKSFGENGGTVVDSVRVPLNNPDFSPYTQRIKDARPDAVFIFVPAGEQAIAFFKSYRERGLAQAGIKVIGPGDVTDDYVLGAMGASTLGAITTFHYSVAHDSPENKNFLKQYAKANPKAGRPNFMAMAAYDGMEAIYRVVKQLNGKIDPDEAMKILKGMKINSPRGPLVIDADTRDPVQTVYVRRVEMVKGEPYNVEFDKFSDVKDPTR